MEPGAFEPLLVRLMSIHHQGAIAMADEAAREAGDPRLKLMSHAIRHEQSGEIELMRGVRGWPAVKAAVASLLSLRARDARSGAPIPVRTTRHDLLGPDPVTEWMDEVRRQFGWGLDAAYGPRTTIHNRHSRSARQGI